MKQKDEMYRIYITDALKAIADTLAKTYGGASPQKRFIEYFPEVTGRTSVEETRTPQEIIGSMKQKLNKLAGD